MMLRRSFTSIQRQKNQTIISIVGNEISKTPDVLKKLFTSINDIDVTMVSYGGSPHNISLLVDSKYKLQTLQALNSGLFGL